MKWSRKNIRIALSLVAVSAVAAFVGNACSGFSGIGMSGSGSNSNASTGTPVMACQEPTFQTVPGTITLSIEYGSTILANMQSCLGLSNSDLSQQTISDNAARLPSFSQAGYVGDTNSAMMMGIAQVAIDACNDLATKEAALPTTSRNYFPLVDFTQPTMTTSAIDDSANRIARECWQRQPTSAELQVIENGTQAMGSVGAQFQVDNICASILASLAGVSNPAGVM